MPVRGWRVMSSVRLAEQDHVRSELLAATTSPEPERSHRPSTLVAAAGRPGVILGAVLVPAIAAGSVGSAGVLEICIVAAVWVATVRGTCGAFDGLLGAWPASFIGACAAL